MIEEKTKIQYSKFQEDIFNTVMTTNKNIVVKATAGSGKTFTTIEISKLIPPNKSCIFVAFNKSIVEELQLKLPPNIECCTVHSKGMSALTSFFKTHLKLNEFKTFRFAEKYLKDLDRKEKFIKMFKYADILNKVRLTLQEISIEIISEICTYYDIDIENSDVDNLINISKDMSLYNYFLGSENNIIDFTDMIHLPVVQTRIKLNQYDYVIVDELQDLNKCQREFIKRIIKPGGRFVGVGDDFQCQPKGTKILMSDLSEKNIEDLKIGDCIVTYDTKYGGGFKGVRAKGKKHKSDNQRPSVLKIEKRRYKGKLIVIKTKNEISKYTPEHICMIRFNPNPLYKEAQALYLMEKDGYFRIGITPYQSKAAHNPALTSRAKQEKANNFWVLDIFETKREAYLSEQYYSYTYGIPQLRFFDNQTGVFDQEELDELWNRFDKVKMKKNAISLLKSFNRDIKYPLWERSRHNYFSKTHIRPIVACNIIPKYMQVSSFNFNKKEKRGNGTHYFLDYQDIELSYEDYNDYVYSLEVPRYKNYVADGILTHNCIYSFLGADPGSFKAFTELPNTIQLPLSISYRCSKAVVEEAKKICPDIHPHDEAIEGEVRSGDFDEVQEGDFILCRNNRPLIYAYFKMIQRGLKCVIRGKDIEKGLVDLIIKVKNKDVERGMEYLNSKLLLKQMELKEKGISKPANHPSFLLLKEKVLTIDVIIKFKKFGLMSQVIDFIEEVFSDDSKEGVQLMTVHKSKGLEAENVFFIEKFEGKRLIPSSYATKEWELEQEKNLMFVAITRAKNKFVYLTL